MSKNILDTGLRRNPVLGATRIIDGSYKTRQSQIIQAPQTRSYARQEGWAPMAYRKQGDEDLLNHRHNRKDYGPCKNRHQITRKGYDLRTNYSQKSSYGGGRSSSGGCSSDSHNINRLSSQRPGSPRRAVASSRKFEKNSQRYDQSRSNNMDEQGSHFFREHKIELMHQNLIELVTRYQKTVFSSTDSSNLIVDLAKEERKNVWYQSQQHLLLLQQLHKKHQQFNSQSITDETTQKKDFSKVLLERVQRSEQDFAELCRLLKRLTRSWANLRIRPPKDIDLNDSADKQQNRDCTDMSTLLSCNVAEDLLLGLLQLRSDRHLFVEAAYKQDQQNILTKLNNESAKAFSWTSWIQQIFILPNDDTNNIFVENREGKGRKEIAAHLNPEYGANVSVFHQVMKSIYESTQCSIATCIDQEIIIEHPDDAFRWKRRMRGVQHLPRKGEIERAARLTSLLKIMVDNRIVPDGPVLDLVLQSHVTAGQFDNAKMAEHIYYQHGLRLGIALFHAVLRAYRIASLFEPKASRRAAAARQTEWLLQKRETFLTARNTKSDQDSMAILTPPRRMHPLSHVSFTLVLQTLSNPGMTALPDMCNRAEGIMELWMGKEGFQGFQERLDNTKSNMDLSDILEINEIPALNVFHHLILLYVSSNLPDKLKRAKRLLQYMETQQDRVSVNNIFPNTWTYNAILLAMLRQTRQITTFSKGNRDKNRFSSRHQRNSSAGNAVYAMKLLDSMVEHPGSRPDRETFRMLLKLWARTKSPQCGVRAEEILTRMEIYSACSSSAWAIDRSSYQSAMLCMTEAAERGAIGSAKRAMRILDKMESQCNASIVIEDPNICLKSVYNDKLRPESFEYEKVIQTCSRTCIPSDKDVALEIAFDAYNRMIEHGIHPTAGSYSWLLICCANLLPNELNRRLELANHVFQAASDQNKMSQRVLDAFRLAKGEEPDTT